MNLNLKIFSESYIFGIIAFRNYRFSEVYIFGIILFGIIDFCIEAFQMTKNGATGTLQYVFKVQVRLQMITGPLSTKKWEKSWEKSYFLIFQEVFRTRYGQFQVPNDPKWCLRYPQLGILMQWFVITGLLVHWAQKGGRNWDKSQKSHFLGSFQRWIWPFIGLKTVPIDQNWFFSVLGGPLGYAKMFPNVCWCNQGNLRVQN